jgi:hypothetical protein
MGGVVEVWMRWMCGQARWMGESGGVDGSASVSASALDMATFLGSWTACLVNKFLFPQYAIAANHAHPLLAASDAQCTENAITEFRRSSHETNLFHAPFAVWFYQQ